jgi:predicted glycosyltransferase
MDYEHQPANHLAFRLAARVLLPEALRGTRVARQGAARGKTRFYDGLKEELYLGEFEPDPEVLAAVGLEPGLQTPLVVARTPPSGALYHRSENRLFIDALVAAAKDVETRCVVLARRPEQRRQIAALGLPNVTMPERAVDSRSLIYEADLVIGAGGTMTREAALLGTPTISVFAGRPPAVDLYLEAQGKLRRIRSVTDLPRVHGSEPRERNRASLRARGERLVEDFTGLIEEISNERKLWQADRVCIEA